MTKNNIIVFATYWNEIDWIESSLEQIDKINPIEVIICDGCFDDRKKNKSTDWTREIIEKWVWERNNARMISAIRVPHKINGFFWLLKNFNFPNIVRIYTAAIAMIENKYRINQALTFNHMRNISNHWKEWLWFMNYDADQFYSDEIIENIKKYCNQKNKYWLLTANENTFFNDFENYTDQYEKRDFNNMPHKIYSNTFVKPTRDNHREYMFSRKYYKDDSSIISKVIGTYNHYKFRPINVARINDGYNLWDRKPPNIEQYISKKYDWKHSSIITNNFLNIK